MPFHVTHNIRQIPLFCADYQMYMARHDTPRIKFESFIFNAIFKTINYNVAVNPPNKNINPIHGCKTYKIKLIMLMKGILLPMGLKYKLLGRIPTILKLNMLSQAECLLHFGSKLRFAKLRPVSGLKNSP